MYPLLIPKWALHLTDPSLLRSSGLQWSAREATGGSVSCSRTPRHVTKGRAGIVPATLCLLDDDSPHELHLPLKRQKCGFILEKPVRKSLWIQIKNKKWQSLQHQEYPDWLHHCLYCNCTTLNHKPRQRVVKTAQHISRAELPSSEDFYTQWCRNKANRIIRDTNHTSDNMFWCCHPADGTAAFGPAPPGTRNSFIIKGWLQVKAGCGSVWGGLVPAGCPQNEFLVNLPNFIWFLLECDPVASMTSSKINYIEWSIYSLTVLLTCVGQIEASLLNWDFS